MKLLARGTDERITPPLMAAPCSSEIAHSWLRKRQTRSVQYSTVKPTRISSLHLAAKAKTPPHALLYFGNRHEGGGG